MARPVLICDFDGTLTTKDLGDALCERFAEPGWQAFDEAWIRREISLPDAQRKIWAQVPARLESLRAHALAVGEFRDGADALFDAVEGEAIDLVIASGGFDLYVDPLLGDRRASVRAVYCCNRLHDGDHHPLPEFPHAELACSSCGVCKAEVIRRHRNDGAKVAFCGNGSSDRCAAGVADLTFAVRGDALEAYCRAQGIGVVAFDSFSEVLSTLQERFALAEPTPSVVSRRASC